MKKSDLGFIMLVVVAGGLLMGYVVLKLPLALSMICCAFGAALAMFIGMILLAVITKSNHDMEANAALSEMKASMGNLLIQQKNAYMELLKASSRLVARRVAERTVVEMMHGLDNDEQRDAAVIQMNNIVDEELDTLQKALELTGKT